MGYLKCKSCGGRYDLQAGELPGDFESCRCGGELEFYDDRGHRRIYKPMNKGIKKSSGMSPLMMLLIVLGVNFFLIQIIGSIIIGYMSALNEIDYSSSYILLLSVQIIMSLIIAVVVYFLIKK